MARITARPMPKTVNTLKTCITECPECGRTLWSAYFSQRTLVTLDGPLRLNVQVRHCRNSHCRRQCIGLRAEAEGRLALPQQEFGLDVIALVGALRYQQHRSVPEIHQQLLGRGLSICQRTVTNLLDRYDELLALRLGESGRLREIIARQGRLILAIDGLQPDVGHEVLWVIRDCLSGEVLLARSLLSSAQADLVGLIEQVKADLGLMEGKKPVKVEGVISDGQHSIRNAIEKALPGVPHQLCQFHYLKEAGRLIFEMDRHAKKELKKRVRNIRPVERAAEAKAAAGDEEAQAVLGYCSAVRSAITDDGKPPLDCDGLQLQGRLTAVSASLAKVEEKRGYATNCKN